MQIVHQEMTSDGAPEGLDPEWAIHNLSFERMYISELRHMAAGSWQPVLYYKFD